MNNEHGIGPADFNLVKKIAGWVYKMYCPKQMQNRMSMDDLYHTGIIGLLKAGKGMDPSKNPDAYKAIRVKGAMLDFLRKLDLVQPPKELLRQAKEVRAAAMELKKAGRESTPEAVSAYLGWPLEAVQKALDLNLSMVPTEESTRGDENRRPGVVLAGTEPDPEQAMARAELAAAVRKCLDALESPIDRFILVCRYMHEMNLKHLALSLNLSIEGVRQKQLRAEKRMKECLEQQGLSKEILE